MSTVATKAKGVSHTADAYFTDAREVLEYTERNPLVVYRCFMRTDAIAVHKFAQDYLKRSGVRCKFTALVAEGTFVPAKTPLFEIAVRMQEFVEHETSLLWYVGWPSLCCLNAYRIRKEAGKKIKVFDMAARHCPGPEAVQMASYAAHLAGFDGSSTKLGTETYKGDEPSRTMPHAIIGAFESTSDAANAYSATFPDRKIAVLVDYHGQELDDAVACYKALGSRLAAVRIDTHGGRYCQGVTDTSKEGVFAALTRLQKEFGVNNAGMYDDYATGKGVTVEAAFVLRQALDKAGARKVKIIVSSGFTLAKVAAFKALGAPIDSIGTGSFLPIDIRDTYATMDIVSYDGKSKIKVGREWLLK